MITKLGVKNFKSIKEALIYCSGVNIIIGANNSGKSNLLEALEFYSRSITMPLEEVFGPGPFSFFHIFHKGSDIKKEGIEISIDFNGNSYASHSLYVESKYKGQKYPRYQLEVVTESIQSSECQLQATNQPSVLLREKGMAKDLPRDLVEMYAACKGIRKFQFSPKIIKKEREIDPLEPHVPFLKYDGANLVNVLFGMRDLDPDTYRSIIDNFQDIYPEVAGISFTHLGDYRYALEFTRIISDKNWSFLSPQISDGFVITLAILTLVHLQKTNRIVLIEEIENGLNPFTLGKILKKILLTSKNAGTQFFITSHSPVLLEYLNHFPEMVIVCDQHEGQSTYTPLPEILKKFKNDYHTGDSLVELWLEGLIGGL